MLELRNIKKDYAAGVLTVRALRGIDLAFRKNEFVSILGPSGCGKTTLLNIIGGLDRYTSGDLLIGGRSTKEFRDGDWDAYRNHSIGFVFQNYNLIPHQTVLSNVELALTLAGVGKAERRRRAAAALEKVGLGDQLKKKPAQMSGGQMQRVAIARALVNDPEIVLADEPTGALDSETSVAVMELLREVAQDRLVIMVTHNPELAEKYSTRIIRLKDGQLISDSDPYTGEVTSEEKAAKGAKGTGAKSAKKVKKPSMSFGTALSLSLNNLMTKRGRTFLTSFAGSIGIIGIALILALSSGINSYIATVQEDTLSSYPIAISRVTQDYTAMAAAMGAQAEKEAREVQEGTVYVDDSAGAMMSAMSATHINDLEAFRTYLEAHMGELTEERDGTAAISNVQYTYDYDLQVYAQNGATRANPTTIFEHMGDYFTYLSSMMSNSAARMDLADMFNIFSRMQDNDSLLREQYDLISGEWATGDDEMMLVLDENNAVSNLVTYILGINDQNELEDMFNDLMQGKEYTVSDQTFSYDDFLNMTLYLVPNSAYYEKTDKTYTANGETYPVWEDVRERADFDQERFVQENGIAVRICGIVRPNPDAIAPSISGVLAYNTRLLDRMIGIDRDSEIAEQQMATAEYDVFTGVPFGTSTVTPEMVQLYLLSLSDADREKLIASISLLMPGQEVTEDNLAEVLLRFAQSEEGGAMLGGQFTTEGTYDDNLKAMGCVNEAVPESISLYCINFAGKDRVSDLIDRYNASMPEEKQIRYTDLVGLLMSSITTIINVISYVLIAFVSISLVVSSVMIGIITYISVLERTKEIGVLRAIGASKRDISRVFNAETLLIGLCSGLIGVAVTVLLCFPINAVIRSLSGIGNIGAALPWLGAVILVAISTALTLIAGFIPARIASKRDPVEALRTE